MAWKDLQTELAEEFGRLAGCGDSRQLTTAFLPTAEQVRRWRKENPERSKEIARRYYAKNRDEINARARARRAADPEKYLEQERRKRERRRARNGLES